MPYIKKEHRSDYTQSIKELGMLINLHTDLKLSSADEKCATAYVSVIQRVAETVQKYYLETDKNLRPGHLNFLFTSIIHTTYGSKMRYYDHNEVIGVLQVLQSGLDSSRTASNRGGHLREVFNRILIATYNTNNTIEEDTIEILGLLACCSQEMYRRSTAVYEDFCITLNGDVTPESQ